MKQCYFLSTMDQHAVFLQLLYLGLHRVKHEEKSDVYDFGVILLEIIMGRPVDSTDEVDVERNQVRLMFYVSSLFPYWFLNICINLGKNISFC